jgi:hypothetical protein
VAKVDADDQEGAPVDERSAEQRRATRRAALRALPTPTDIELEVRDAPPLSEVIDDLPEPRISELDALLRDVDALRDTMRRDLTLAATAAEAGADELAGWLLLNESGAVRAFEDRALARLDALEAASVEVPDIPAPRRVRRMLPAAPMVAAAAAIDGFMTGAIPGTGGPAVTTPKTSNSALQSYAHLAQLASTGASATRISAAAEKFHAALAPLVADAAANPAAAEKAIALLQSERAVISGEADSPALRAVLAQADLLVRKLRATLPHPVRSQLPLVVEHRQASTAPKSSPAPKATPSPSPSRKASPSASPSAKSSPKASPTSSPDPGPLDGAPHSLPG